MLVILPHGLLAMTIVKAACAQRGFMTYIGRKCMEISS
jgi:hypothetical protein